MAAGPVPFGLGKPVFGNRIRDLSQGSVALSQLPSSYFQPPFLNSGVFPKVLPVGSWEAVGVASLHWFFYKQSLSGPSANGGE